MSQTNMTTEEVLDSLDGFDEMGILEQFGRSVGQLIPEPGMYRRALGFVVKRREGLNEDDARNFMMQMRLADVLDFFPDKKLAPGEGVSDDDAAAIQESGKDEPQPETLPAPSLTSVS